MKKDIHPEYHQITVKCSTCGTKHTMGTTSKEVTIDVCSSCHPFYTGNRSNMKSTGRVERFNRMFGEANVKKPAPKKKPTPTNKPTTVKKPVKK